MKGLRIQQLTWPEAELALQRVLAVDDTGPVVVAAIGNFAPIDRAVPYVREWLDASGHKGMERQSDPAVKVVTG